MGRCVLGSAWGTKHQAAPRQQGSQSTDVNANTGRVDGTKKRMGVKGNDGDQPRYRNKAREVTFGAPTTEGGKG